MGDTFLFDSNATYVVIPNDNTAAPTSLLKEGKLFLFRHGKLDLQQAMGDIRGSVLYLLNTDIVIGSLVGDCLTLNRTKATFTVIPYELPTKT